VCYFAISLETTIFVPGIGETSASNVALGVSMALGLGILQSINIRQTRAEW